MPSKCAREVKKKETVLNLLSLKKLKGRTHTLLWDPCTCLVSAPLREPYQSCVTWIWFGICMIACKMFLKQAFERPYNFLLIIIFNKN